MILIEMNAWHFPISKKTNFFFVIFPFPGRLNHDHFVDFQLSLGIEKKQQDSLPDELSWEQVGDFGQVKNFSILTLWLQFRKQGGTGRVKLVKLWSTTQIIVKLTG